MSTPRPSGSSFDPASPGPIGGTTPNTGAFTLLTSTGSITSASDIIAGSNSGLRLNSRSQIRSSANGIISFLSNGATGFTQAVWGLATSNFTGLSTQATNGLAFQSGAGTSTWNDAATATSGTAALRTVLNLPAPTFSATNATTTATEAATLYIGGAPAASSMTITNAYALHVASGRTLLEGQLIASTAGLGGGSQLMLKDSANSGMAAGHLIEFMDSANARQVYIYKEPTSGSFNIGNDQNAPIKFVANGVDALVISGVGAVSTVGALTVGGVLKFGSYTVDPSVVTTGYVQITASDGTVCDVAVRVP